jgi:hypothetical protein
MIFDMGEDHSSTKRITINAVDRMRPMDEWKPLLADFGRRRHLSYTMDFDTRALVFDEPGPGWNEETRRIHYENQERVKIGLSLEFGSDHLDKKIENFIAIGTKPFSVIAYHNQFFDQSRRSFVIGAYYPALVSACALGERILNHLILDMRNYYTSTPEYKSVSRKSSFDNWEKPIATLEAWNILLPQSAVEFRALWELR